MDKASIEIAALGCSGEVARPFIDGFISLGAKVRLLARNPEQAAHLHPGATLVKGDMTRLGDVVDFLNGVRVAFFVSPMGLRNDGTLERETGRTIIEAARAAGLGHLIYISVIGGEVPTGVALLDAKRDIERNLKDSGLSWSVIRCGTYMEDLFDKNSAAIRAGGLFFPINKTRRFTYTSQRDVPRFVVEELLQKDRALNAAINLCDPRLYTLLEVEAALSQATGRRVSIARKFPLHYLLRVLQPLFHLAGHKYSSLIPLARHFDRNGFVYQGQSADECFPQFSATSLQQHLKRSFGH